MDSFTGLPVALADLLVADRDRPRWELDIQWGTNRLQLGDGTQGLEDWMVAIGARAAIDLGGPGAVCGLVRVQRTRRSPTDRYLSAAWVLMCVRYRAVLVRHGHYRGIRGGS